MKKEKQTFDEELNGVEEVVKTQLLQLKSDCETKDRIMKEKE